MMMKLKFLPISAFLLIFPFVTLYSQQRVISLQEAIKVGLERNFSLQISRNNEEVALNNVSLGNAGFLPRLNLRGQQSATLNNTDNEFANLSWMGNHNTTSNAGLNISWDIFDGFSARTTYRMLNTFAELGELSTRLQVENLVADIASEYYNLIQQNQLLVNLRYSLDLSRERVRIDEERYLIGSGSKLQLLQAQVFMNADSSRLSRQYEVVRASRIRLNELLAMDDMQEVFVVADSSIIVNPGLELDKLVNGAVNSNTALLMASQNKVLSEYEQKLIAANSYPYLSFNAGYGYTYNTFESDQVGSQHTVGMNYGFTLGFSIFDGFNQRRRLANAEIEIQNSQLRFRELETSMLADLHIIYNAYQNYLRLLEMENQNLAVASETLEIAIERYRLGELAGIELRDVQSNLLEAEERLLSIQYQTKLAEISLLQISGRIAEYL